MSLVEGKGKEEEEEGAGEGGRTVHVLDLRRAERDGGRGQLLAVPALGALPPLLGHAAARRGRAVLRVPRGREREHVRPVRGHAGHHDLRRVRREDGQQPSARAVGRAPGSRGR